MRVILYILGIVGILAAAVFAAFAVSPWPSALVIRYVFEKDGRAVNAALARHVPANVTARLDQRYDDGDSDALFDVYYPTEIEDTARSLPTIVWVHGGAFVSGSKDDVANYLRILAGQGYTTVGVDYSLAPAKAYPTPLRQTSKALAHLVANARQLHVDPARIVLAGDSAGAHIVVQLASIITAPEYARAVGIAPVLAPSQLAGTILYCGPYDIGAFKLDGPLGGFMTTVLWSYSGSRNHTADKAFAFTTVINHLTPKFPSAFISAGNGDPLLPHSLALAEVLTRLGVKVDSLFFPKDQTPALPHEYQFNLDTEAGRLALARSLSFLSGLFPPAR